MGAPAKSLLNWPKCKCPARSDLPICLIISSDFPICLTRSDLLGLTSPAQYPSLWPQVGRQGCHGHDQMLGSARLYSLCLYLPQDVSGPLLLLSLSQLICFCLQIWKNTVDFSVSIVSSRWILVCQTRFTPISPETEPWVIFCGLLFHKKIGIFFFVAFIFWSNWDAHALQCICVNKLYPKQWHTHDIRGNTSLEEVCANHLIWFRHIQRRPWKHSFVTG
jgi:hypothetical protein